MFALFLIILNIIFSYKGLKDRTFYDRYDFQVEKILLYKDYKRLITSGFLHVNWLHLGLNMLALYFFSGTVEASLGELNFLLIYFGSLVGANLLTLFIHRNHSDYGSVGASGAICGVVFAAIALYPYMRIGLIILPAIPAWIYGVLYMAFAIYGVRSKKNNVGHEAHLGGSLLGMLLASLISPASFVENYPVILLITVPALIFIYLIITRPHLLLIDNLYFKRHTTNYSIDHRYNAERKNKQEEIDRLLDKIGRKGINSLTTKEREFLKRHSQDVQ
jgi:membrane associated rhomboid family serine protease